jgi:hypothetical protein
LTQDVDGCVMKVMMMMAMMMGVVAVMGISAQACRKEMATGTVLEQHATPLPWRWARTCGGSVWTRWTGCSPRCPACARARNRVGRCGAVRLSCRCKYTVCARTHVCCMRLASVRCGCELREMHVLL